MARHERLAHVNIISKNTSAIISNPNGNSQLKNETKQKQTNQIAAGRSVLSFSVLFTGSEIAAKKSVAIYWKHKFGLNLRFLSAFMRMFYKQ
jgi:flagellar basal body rod protein FlgF